MRKIETKNIKCGKHYTKKELALKKAREILGNNDNIVVPDFLTVPQKKEFEILSAELERAGIMTNLDCDVLGQYIQAKDSYLFYCGLISEIRGKGGSLDEIMEYTLILEKYEGLKDKAFKQCQTCANALGLNISARGKIKKPVQEEKPPENKFAKFQKSG